MLPVSRKLCCVCCPVTNGAAPPRGDFGPHCASATVLLRPVRVKAARRADVATRQRPLSAGGRRALPINGSAPQEAGGTLVTAQDALIFATGLGRRPAYCRRLFLRGSCPAISNRRSSGPERRSVQAKLTRCTTSFGTSCQTLITFLALVTTQAIGPNVSTHE